MADKDIKNEGDVMVLGSETEEEMPEVKSANESKDSEKVKEKKEEEDVKPKLHLSAGGPSETELNDDKKSKLVEDLSWICSVDVDTAREMLEANKWDLQVCRF